MDAADSAKPVRSRAKYHSPPANTFAVRAVAMAHFLFAALILLSSLINTTVDGSGIDQSMANSLSSVDSPQVRKLQRDLRRTGEIKDGLHQRMTSRLPAAATISTLNQTLDIGLAVLLAIAGTCLMQRQSLGRVLSFTFAGVCLAQKFAMLVWLSVAEVPKAKEYLEMLKKMHPADADLIQGILTPLANGPLQQVIWAIYPLVVLAVMLQPSVQAALVPDAAPATRPPKDDQVRTLMPPAVPTVVAAPAVDVPPQDPLEALLQRRTF